MPKTLIQMEFSNTGTKKLDDLQKFWGLKDRCEVLRVALKSLSFLTSVLKAKETKTKK